MREVHPKTDDKPCKKRALTTRSRHHLTQNGDPLQNAIAERVNGIFKAGSMMDRPFASLQQARHEIQQ